MTSPHVTADRESAAEAERTRAEVAALKQQMLTLQSQISQLQGKEARLLLLLDKQKTD